jgi:hypothetical protein
MSKRVQLGSALLWASAVVAAAALGAPTSLTLLVLPALAAGAWALLLRQGACPATPSSAA